MCVFRSVRAQTDVCIFLHAEAERVQSIYLAFFSTFFVVATVDASAQFSAQQLPRITQKTFTRRGILLDQGPGLPKLRFEI